ncbi:MAG: ATP-binding protein [Deltaproteobacteria bacterium]|nr:ATP-binding protein [Deltaproteobacteria bacterium]
MREKIRELIDSLRFKGMAQILDQELDRAEREGTAVSEVIYRVLLKEIQYRKEKSQEYRLRQAKIPWSWTGLSFMDRTDNVIFIGPPGAGKTGLAIGLLRKALVSGYRGRFYNAQDLLDEIYASMADRTTPKLLGLLARYDLLLIDELGYLTLKPEQANAFFKLMDRRYGRKSTIITTNLDYPEWYDLFQRKSLLDALLDRLRHHCITIRIDGPSLRVSKPPFKTNTEG